MNGWETQAERHGAQQGKCLFGDLTSTTSEYSIIFMCFRFHSTSLSHSPSPLSLVATSASLSVSCLLSGCSLFVVRCSLFVVVVVVVALLPKHTLCTYVRPYCPLAMAMASTDDADDFADYTLLSKACIELGPVIDKQFKMFARAYGHNFVDAARGEEEHKAAYVASASTSRCCRCHLHPHCAVSLATPLLIHACCRSSCSCSCG